MLIVFLSVMLYVRLPVAAQVSIKGSVVSAADGKPLPFVNIGIRHKNRGTVSREDGTFFIEIPSQQVHDTLTFSLVGYGTIGLPVKAVAANSRITLSEKPKQLNTVTIQAEKMVEAKFGIVKYRPLIHFTDRSTNQDDIFEIAQLVRLDTIPSRITSVNLFIGETRKDSAVFRINFYRYDGNQPEGRVVEKSIIQTHAVQKGWLKFNLVNDVVYLKGDVVVGIEFMPSAEKTDPIAYELKLGGAAKSFVRTQSHGDWIIPPHHYRMFVTALVTDNARKKNHNTAEEREAVPAFRLYASAVQDSFSVFVRLPAGYGREMNKKHPVVYLLDANAYFDQVADFMDGENKRDAASGPILIGVGYADFAQNDTLRNRDYTFPQASPEDSFALSGGANRFLRFLQTELIPFIDAHYLTDTTHRTLMGHSLGGYFTVYAMEQQLAGGRVYFSNLVAASPSLSYCNNYLIRQLSGSSSPHGSAPANLLLTIGSLENDGKLSLPDEFTVIIKALSADTGKKVNVSTEVYKNYDHMETAVRTFKDALDKIRFAGTKP
ncbi:carboxypeptidase-like regulatory domain-containing protein [Chitinophaga oryzae]|uniref:Carboxypeptidase-like regulatory domain-containing protein n=1 Tax=Chitinophaga oryzae TaxID=2725414 RepID=A0AAE6ZHJ4_9BACT|nr:alpha/beta hydrolase-fold protein [Chitinophaga oryzae]QJB32833.1 carboxypeptidase-like regulatory domain-containing protein [Chitinophaga oryzae]